MIVMLAFLSRFWLDAKNSDLTDEIENRKSLITASLDFEKDFKSTQAKLSVVSNLLKKPEFYPTLNSLSAYVPTGVTVNQMTVSEEKINLQGQTASEPQLMLFITNLYSSDNFKNANLTSLKSAADTAFLDFELTINLGPEKES
jgi:Tfp pilus assembly protein PilN